MFDEKEKIKRASKRERDLKLKFRKRKFTKSRSDKLYKNANGYTIAQNQGITEYNVKKLWWHFPNAGRRSDGNFRAAGMFSGIKRGKFKTLKILIDDGFAIYNDK